MHSPEMVPDKNGGIGERASTVIHHWVWRGVDLYVVPGVLVQKLNPVDLPERRHDVVESFVRYAGWQDDFENPTFDIYGRHSHDCTERYFEGRLFVLKMKVHVMYGQQRDSVHFLKRIEPTWNDIPLLIEYENFARLKDFDPNLLAELSQTG
jgi:hypothetical protein